MHGQQQALHHQKPTRRDAGGGDVVAADEADYHPLGCLKLPVEVLLQEAADRVVPPWGQLLLR